MKKFDLTFVILSPLLVISAIFIFNITISYLMNIFLVFGIPMLYLALKNKITLKKICIFTAFVFFPLAIIIELIALSNNVWLVPSSFFSFRLLGIPLEDFTWMFFVTALILLFHEHFIEKKTEMKPSTAGLRLMVFLLYPIALMVLLLFVFVPNILLIPYAYFWVGFIFLFIPTITYLCRYKKDFFGFLKTSVYIFFIFFIFEIIGVEFDHWVFEGENYLGWVNFFGVRFPIEEFFYVLISGGFTALSYYNFFMKKYGVKTSVRS